MASSFNSQPQHSNSSNHSSSQSPTILVNHDAPPATIGHNNSDGSYVPRPKRIACAVCRRRKLRCDGKKPSCGTCARLGHECTYEEARKKSGPKRGYVKQLEARLAQVETLLKTQEPNVHHNQGNDFPVTIPDGSPEANEIPPLPGNLDTSIPYRERTPATGSTPSFVPVGADGTEHFGWDMISLGLEEPLPTREVIDELNQIFFDKVYPCIPVIHRPRYMAAMDFAPNIRPPVCLQYIIWCTAASVTDKYANLHGLFYQRARKYADIDEMKGLGEGIISLAHCQTWLLIGVYEYKMMYFPRAWLSAGKAARLGLMLGIHRLDTQTLEVKQCLPSPRDWVEREERRRVFWMAFCVDRYASIGTGWPVVFDERDVMTNLPAGEEAFLKGTLQQTPCLADVLGGDGLQSLSPFASVCFMSCLFGRNLTHLHRPDPQDNDSDLNGVFWQRHRSHDNILLHFALSMPNHLRLPTGMADPNVIFCNMAVHTSTICLHQAAIFKAEKNKMPEQIILESKRRCIVAAEQISSIMKMVSHMDLTTMNPFVSFCVYVAARVFVQYLKFRPDDTAARSSLQFVFSVMDALKSKNPLTESFLLQLDVDIEGTSFHDIRLTPTQPKKRKEIFIHEVQEKQPASTLDSANQFSLRTRNFTLPGQICRSDQQKFATSQQPTLNAASLDPNLPNMAKASYNQGLRTEPGVPGPVVDMSLLPEFSDTSNPARDDSTPSTLNSSSTASFLRTDQPSPPNNTQQQQQPLSNTVHQDSVANVFFPVSVPPGLLPTGIVTPMDSTGSDGAIPISSSWNYSSTSNANPNEDNIDLMTGGIEQWAHLLGAGGWNS